MAEITRGGEVAPPMPPHELESAEYWTASGTVRSLVPRPATERLLAREQARVADPVPLGLAGFAAATFVVSTMLCGWFSMHDLMVAVPVLFLFGGVTQFLAGMWAYARGNMLATVAFGSFGAFNACYATLIVLQAIHLVQPLTQPGSDQSKVAGVFILMFCLIAGFLAFAATGENMTMFWILAFLSFAYLADGTGLWIGGYRNVVLSIGGYSGLVSAILAFYLSAAFVTNGIMQREVIPTFAVKHGEQVGAITPADDFVRTTH